MQGEKAIKLFHGSLPERSLEDEANKQKYAYSCGLSVPFIDEVTKINGKQAILMEYVAGRTFGDIILEEMDKAPQLMSLSVEIQMSIGNYNNKVNHIINESKF